MATYERTPRTIHILLANCEVLMIKCCEVKSNISKRHLASALIQYSKYSAGYVLLEVECSSQTKFSYNKRLSPVNRLNILYHLGRLNQKLHF